MMAAGSMNLQKKFTFITDDADLDFLSLLDLYFDEVLPLFFATNGSSTKTSGVFSANVNVDDVRRDVVASRAYCGM